MKNILFITTSIFICSILFINLNSCNQSEISNQKWDQETDRIQPYEQNPYYWQYRGEPLFLIGGGWQDNLFNHPVGLTEHLNLMVSVGANYTRNVMSHRNIGNVFAYEQDENRLFDLDQFNKEYWQRFENFLQLTYDRDIIVQLEIWATWDLYEDHQSLGGWSFNPFNPQNNITYTPSTSRLPTEINYAPQTEPTEHPFFKTVPLLDNNELLLQYQTEYVNKILSYSLNYPHILYTINNETGEYVEWGDFWADHIQNMAGNTGTTVEITDMRRNEDIRSQDHLHIIDNPERYTFLDISQNNAWSGLGQQHYENILYIRDLIASQPRPINNNKNYGATRHGEEESVARMGRILFAGGASARFHRPHPYEEPEYHEAKSDFGLGLSPRAQHIIKSLSMVTNELDIERMEPRSHLLSDREENEAYLLADPGNQYAIYFPDGGSVSLNTRETTGVFKYRWINLDESKWGENHDLPSDDVVRFTAPGSDHWIVVILN